MSGWRAPKVPSAGSRCGTQRLRADDPVHPDLLLFTVGGSIYIESLYSIPGMGGLLVDVISRQDNPMVQVIVMIYSCVGIVGMLLGDILMVLIDPRITFAKKEGVR